MVFRDQTKRHEAEVALVESEHRFRTMADQLPMFMWEHDADGTVRWVNQTLCDFAGLARDQMFAGGWELRPIRTTVSTSPTASWSRSSSCRTEFHGQARMRRWDGEWRWIETWGRPRYGSGGDYLGHLGTSVDVTDRVEGEQAVRNGARFLRRLIDNLFAFVGVLTPDGTLIEANQAPLDAAGISSDDVIGRKFWEARWWTVDARTQEQLRDAVERAAAGEVVRYDVQVRGTGDDLIWIDFQLAPLSTTPA
jgi:PAS domain S-box-containing protein